jgi:hypothetical protein
VRQWADSVSKVLPGLLFLAPIKQRIEWHQHNAKTPGSDGAAMTAAFSF